MRHRLSVGASRRGQAAVEATLVALVFLVTLIGIFDMGQIFFIHQTLAERVRNASRYGAVRAFDANAFRNMVLYNQPTAPEGSPSGTFGLTADMVSVTRQDAGTHEDRLIVTITNYPYRFFTPLIAGVFHSSRPLTISIPYEVP